MNVIKILKGVRRQISMATNNTTVHEHYIPKMILKHFSKDGKNIWLFDKGKNLSRYIPYASQRYKDDLYEFIGKYTGQDVNLIEHCLSHIEHKTDTIIRDKILPSKELEEEEQGIIGIFTILQLLRTPSVMVIVKDIVKDIVKGMCSNYSEEPINIDFIDRFSKISSLCPIISSEYKDINIIFDWTWKTFIEGNKLTIYKASKPFIFNGETLVCFIPYISNQQKSFIFLPITPYRCIAFVPNPENLYMEVSEKYVDILNTASFSGKGNLIYSYEKI